MSKSFHKTLVVNESNTDYELKLGNAGQYSELTPLKSKEEYVIECDPNATYREYWVGSAVGVAETIISSDDCAEFKEIIILNECDVDDGRRLLRRIARATNQGESTPESAPATTLVESTPESAPATTLVESTPEVSALGTKKKRCLIQ